MKTIYEKFQEIQKQLEDREIECIKLKRQLEETGNRRNKVNEQMKVVLINILHETHIRRAVPKLSKQSALIFFKHCLKQIQKLGYNREVINSLLDASAFVASIRVNEVWQFRTKALLAENFFLNSEVSHLQMINAQLQFQNTFNSNEFPKQSYIEDVINLTGIL